MSPTERWESGRSTRSSTRGSSSRMATRVSRGFPEISISRFKAVTLALRRETSASREPVVFPAIVQLARPIWRGHRDDSIGEAAERRQSPMHEGKARKRGDLGQPKGGQRRSRAVEGGKTAVLSMIWFEVYGLSDNDRACVPTNVSPLGKNAMAWRAGSMKRLPRFRNTSSMALRLSSGGQPSPRQRTSSRDHQGEGVRSFVAFWTSL